MYQYIVQFKFKNALLIHKRKLIIAVKSLQRFIIEGYCCGHEGSPGAVCVADLKKLLNEDTVSKSLCCEEDAQGCLWCFSLYEVSAPETPQ